MALAISNIPVLSGEVAERFVLAAEEAERNRGCIDFSAQHAIWKDFDRVNEQRIASLKASGKWPF
ncbi:MAG: hypothetical protein MJ249_15610 [Kiritimatiellae bacterium]|nr:hypothetical protein [Kiritimatiellia bacterium]